MQSDSLLAGYIGELELCKQLNIGLRTLRSWRKAGIGPPIMYLGRKPFFRVKSVEDWLRSCERLMPRERRRGKARP